jgi:hypothetical protein
MGFASDPRFFGSPRDRGIPGNAALRRSFLEAIDGSDENQTFQESLEIPTMWINLVKSKPRKSNFSGL